MIWRVQGLHSIWGAQWLSGRVLDSRPRDSGFQPQGRHSVVFLSKTFNPSLELVQSRKTRPYITVRLLKGRKESNQTQIHNILHEELRVCCNYLQHVFFKTLRSGRESLISLAQAVRIIFQRKEHK